MRTLMPHSSPARPLASWRRVGRGADWSGRGRTRGRGPVSTSLPTPIRSHSGLRPAFNHFAQSLVLALRACVKPASLAMAVRALLLAQPPAPVCRLRPAARCCASAHPASRGSLWCRATGDGKATESSVSASDSVRVDGLLGLDQICNEFECKSSPAIESTLRQARLPCAQRRGRRMRRDMCWRRALTASSV